MATHVARLGTRSAPPGRSTAIRLAAWCALFSAAGPAVHASDLHSHFRYGHIAWRSLGGNTVEFALQYAWRRDLYSTALGSCLNPAAGLALVPCTGAGGFAGVGDVIWEHQGFTMFDPGDGAGLIGSPLGPLLFLVTSADAAGNWLLGLALDPAGLPAVDTSISRTYPAAGPYTAFTDTCCRLTAFPPTVHINNPNRGYRIETRVQAGSANSSPVSALPPIVVCPFNGLCSFPVLGADGDGDPLSFRLSLSTEAATFNPPFVQPGPPHAPNAAAIGSSTGLYNWNTTGAAVAPPGSTTLYSTQVTIEDKDGAGNVKSKVAVDFLIQLAALSGTPPFFQHPPTPPCGSTITAPVNQPLPFAVQAADADPGQSVQINAAGLPAGATLAPLPPASGNPLAVTFSWTPSAAQLGVKVVTFEARDNTGQQTLCPIPINVLEQGVVGAQGRMTGGGAVESGANPGRVTHGFTLHCDLQKGPHNLEVNWGRGNAFHLESLTSALCTDNPAIAPHPPPAGFDTYQGAGTGRYNGVSGATATWKFTDAGEPGSNDTAAITIKDNLNNTVLSVAGALVRGNHQAHE